MVIVRRSEATSVIRVLLGLLLLAWARAADGTTHLISVSIEGSVTDMRGQPVGLLTVELLDADADVVARTETNQAGRFLFSEITAGPGRITVRLDQDGARETRQELTIPAGPARQVLRPRLIFSRSRDAKEKNRAIVKVFYATDRRASGLPDLRGFYTAERSTDGALALGVLEVSVPREHRLGELEAPSIWRLELRENPDQHVVLLQVHPRDPGSFVAQLGDRVGRAARKEAFVFVHGYNTSFRDAARRTAQLAYDLAFDGAPILYSWPSLGQETAYPADEGNAEWTVPHLMKFLDEVVSLSGTRTLHLIAHSMGNRVVVGALRDMARMPRSSSPPQFRQVVLAAPDIDAGVFRQLAQAIVAPADRVTLYASSKDAALAASRKFHRQPRAGESGDRVVVVPGVDTIDVSGVDASLLGHSYYGDNRSVLSDLFRLIRDGAPPGQRFGLVPVPHPGGGYWSFRP